MKKNFTIIPFFLFLLFCACFSTAVAQEIRPSCGFDHAHEAALNDNPQFKAQVDAFNQAWLRKQSANKGEERSGVVYTIPVVFHIIHNGEAVGTGSNISDAQIAAALTYTNGCFRKTLANRGGVDSEIELVMASSTPDCAATNGIDRINGGSITSFGTKGVNRNNSDGVPESTIKNLSRWDPSQYLNIWVVGYIDSWNGLTAGSGVVGWATFPGSAASDDGIVMMAAFTNTNQTTLAHELGHYLSVYHTFQAPSGACPSAGANEDFVSDTEAHKLRNDYACAATLTNDCSAGAAYTVVETVGGTNLCVLNNYMNYASNSCTVMFTAGQKSRMITALTANRAGLINSKGKLAGGVTMAVSSNNGYALGCTAPSITLTATGGSTSYAWSTGENTATKSVIANGTYTVTITNTSGCSKVISSAVATQNANGATVAPTTTVSAPIGNPLLDLNLSPQYATAMTLPITGTLTTTDPGANLTVKNTSNTCTTFANAVNYDTYTFRVDQSGTYTFDKGTNSLTLNLYNNSFNQGSLCTNFLNSGSVFSGSSVNTGSSVSATLSAGSTYVLVITTFQTGLPALPTNYSIAVAKPSGSSLYPSTGEISPGANYNYTYVMTKGTTIKAINTSSDLSTLPESGSYNVYGLSYHNTVTNTTLNSYINGTLATMQSAITANTLCANLSTNNVIVDITCPATTASITPASAIICGTQTVTLQASAGANYVWNTAAASSTTQGVNVSAGTYVVTVTAANACTATATATVTAKTAAIATTTGELTLTEDCTSSGWTVYANGNNHLFAIEWQPTGSSYNNAAAKASATVKVALNSANGSATNATEATYSMKRYWNVSLGTPLAGPVNVRFFYDAAEKIALDAAASAYAASISKPVEPSKWFKTVGAAFDPATCISPTAILQNPIELIDQNAGAAATINGALYAQFNGVTSFSGGTYAAGVGNATPLPTTLVAFTGKKVGNQIALRWTTENETNLRNYSIEKSNDGDNFSILMSVAAKNSILTQVYTANDDKPHKGTNYYRIMVQEQDGTHRQEGRVIAIDMSNNIPMSIFPNPSNGKLALKWENPTLESIDISVINTLGTIVKSIHTQATKGENRLELDLNDLTNGTYILTLGQVQKMRFVLLK